MIRYIFCNKELPEQISCMISGLATPSYKMLYGVQYAFVRRIKLDMLSW
jgi:hypothetical protein